MKKFISIISMLTILLIGNVVFAKTTAVPFLSINPGARPAGMGEAFAAIADDATATYWNPAGIAFQNKQQVSLMHSPWLPELDMDLYYEFASYTTEVPEWGHFGLTFTYFSMGEWDRTDEGGNVIGSDKSFDMAGSLSYATKVQENWGVGLNFKVIYSHLASEGVAGEGKGVGVSYAVDLGTLYKFRGLFEGLNGALVLQNLGPDIAYIDEAQADPLPRNLKLGLAYDVFNPNTIEVGEMHKMTVAAEYNKILIDIGDPLVDWSKGEDDDARTELDESVFNIGMEYWFANILGVRLGYMRNAEGFGGEGGESYIKGMTYGAGLKYEFKGYELAFDYGLIPGGDLSAHNEKFSLSARF